MIAQFVYSILLFSISPNVVIEAKCDCGEYIGNHCGDRVIDRFLSGNCDKNYLYYCSAAFFPAQKKTHCESCQNASIPGTDYCSVQNESKEHY